jgi:hypothetical protein
LTRGPGFLLLTLLVASPQMLAHTPVVDASLRDWCVGATSNTYPAGGRTEDSAVELSCGNCSATTNRACEVNSDCPGAETCVNLGSRTEVAWWDNRTDGAVNDLATVAFTQDNTNLYISAELWVDPDPQSLPFGEVAIDYTPGGQTAWHDPNNLLKSPGNCNVSTDRACTSNPDCHFCTISNEPAPSTRRRTCGTACNPDIPGDVCDTSQTCQNLGVGGVKKALGLFSSPASGADYLVLFDFSLWLIGAGDATLVMQPSGAAWAPQTGCTPDFVGDNTNCDSPPAVNPGASGGSGGPPGSVEVAIPWSAFGCTGCPDACVCPGFGPGDPFRFTMTVARGALNIDFAPDGAHEDVMSEPVAGSSSTTTNSCPGMGSGTTQCELADTSTDAYVPLPAAPGGRIPPTMLVTKNAGTSITLDWGASCSALDTDYAVYEGTIGTWYSHVPVTGLCTTGGATVATFNAAAGGRYYLVVPNDGSTEGSYGESTALPERPASTSPCEVQSLGNCP